MLSKWFFGYVYTQKRVEEDAPLPFRSRKKAFYRWQYTALVPLNFESMSCIAYVGTKKGERFYFCCFIHTVCSYLSFEGIRKYLCNIQSCIEKGYRRVYHRFKSKMYFSQRLKCMFYK